MLQLECGCLCVYKGTKGIYLWACTADLWVWLLPTAGAIHPVSSQGSFGSLWFLKDNDTPGSIWHACEAKQCQQMISWMSAHSRRHWRRSQKQELHSCQRMARCQQKVLYHSECVGDVNGCGSELQAWLWIFHFQKTTEMIKIQWNSSVLLYLCCFMLLEAFRHLTSSLLKNPCQEA